MRRAERLGAAAFLVAAAGDDDPEAEQVGERDRHRADAAGAAMDERGLALHGEGALEQIGPDGEQGLRHRRRLDHRQRRRHGQALADRRGGIFGIAAAGDQRADRLADQLARHFLAGRRDDARHFEAGDGGRAGRRRIERRAAAARRAG